MEDKKYDFSGWATKNDLKCSDGRIIRKDAFAGCDRKVVPLVWNHCHNDPKNVLGTALLVNRPEGVYAYGKFNDTENGLVGKSLVKNGDIQSLSICANGLKHQGANVVHGIIREVSLVLSGANPGACIDSVSMAHGDESESASIIYTGLNLENEDFEDEITHSDETEDDNNTVDENQNGDNQVIEHNADDNAEDTNSNVNKPAKKEDTKMANNSEKTVGDVLDSLTDEQRAVVFALIGMAQEEANDGEDGDMKHNAFDDAGYEDSLMHSTMVNFSEAINDAEACGSLRKSVIKHGVTNLEYLFPEPTEMDPGMPKFINQDTTWVGQVLGQVHHTPFARIKSTFADITADEARAKGYMKGDKKEDEVFTLLRRTTDPQTVYKHQSFDRDDMVDLNDPTAIAWLKGEMRGKLNEELARAFLVGDGRASHDRTHISEDHIRPIWTDEDMYTINSTFEVATEATPYEVADMFIDSAVRSRENFQGSGTPVLFTSFKMLSDMLLMKDKVGHRLYKTKAELASALLVSDIVTVPCFSNLTRKVAEDDGATHTLLGIIVNLKDYNVGADKGGAVNMFDDFDIDYNKMKYLIETRCSGALTVPYSAIAIESKPAAMAAAAMTE